MRIRRVPEPLQQPLLQAMGLLVRRLSRVFSSSLRAVRDHYLRDAQAWRPRVERGPGGCVTVEGVVFCFRQVLQDILGGRGRDDRGKPFRLKGGNRLERVRVQGLRSPRGTRYIVFLMEFGDEEHPLPLVDTLYRMLRSLIFARTRDIEAIVAVLPRGDPPRGVAMVFPSICSGEKTFASRLGAHGTCVELVRGKRVDIYVSNVWNHAMSTRNTNPGLPHVDPRPQVIAQAPQEGSY